MILKGVSHEEVVNDECMECRDTQISCIAARVWQSHSRHADLKKVSNQKAPKHPEILGRAIRRTPHRGPSFPT
jgi:ribosomal protein L37AE/L43A